MPNPREKIRAELERRGLVSVMNDTKWTELVEAVRRELPFGPPYQLKTVMNPTPQPERFDHDVDHLGDWSDESLRPFHDIEWLRVRPRILRPRGRLVAPEIQSVEAGFREILRRHQIPHRIDQDTIWVTGHALGTGGLVAGP